MFGECRDKKCKNKEKENKNVTYLAVQRLILYDLDRGHLILGGSNAFVDPFFSINLNTKMLNMQNNIQKACNKTLDDFLQNFTT